MARLQIALGLLVLATAPLHAKKMAAPAKPSQMSLVLVGDVGLNRSSLPVHPKGVIEGGSILSWEEMSSFVAPMIDGDLNFMNLETVVTDRNDLRPADKRQKSPYLFRTHPKGLAHLVDLGFNLISAANNHAYDYDAKGVLETISHLETETEGRAVAFAGVGRNRDEAARPSLLEHKGARIVFSAIGGVTNMIRAHLATAEKAGTLGFRTAADWEEALDLLVAARGDLRVMSVHYGKERHIETDDRQRSTFREAIDKGTDLVIGHHAHVVRGIELRQGKLIFYGLGNFMIRGAANMGAKPSLRGWGDYGLYAKLHYVLDKGRYRIAAVEVVPMTEMQRVPRPMKPAQAAKRVEVLNALAGRFDVPKEGSVGLRFFVGKRGQGVYCDAQLGAQLEGGLCKSPKPPQRVSKEVQALVRRALSPKKKPKQKQKKKRRRRGKRR